MRRSAPALLLVLAAACTSPSEPLHLVVDSSATTSLRVGDTVRVIMDVRNVSNTTIHVGARSCGGKEFVLVSASGTVFQPVTRFALPCAVIAPRALAPGESTRIEGSTDGLVISERVAAIPFYIPPGRYGVRSTVTPWDADVSTIAIQTRPAKLVFRTR